MAKDIKIKGAWFNLNLPEEATLCQYADSINFSDWVKKKLTEEKLTKQQDPSPSAFNPNEIAALVETLVETKLAGRVIATDQQEVTNSSLVDLEQFF